MADIGQIRVVDEASILEALSALNHSQQPTNWVLLGYGAGKNEIVLQGQGTGGLDDFASQLKDDQVQFGVVELVVKGDAYNPVKHVLLTWIGEAVPPGLSKARSAAHRAELLELVKKKVSISTEFQTSKRTEVQYDAIAQSLTRMRATYHTSQDPTEERQSMSRSHAKGGTTFKMTVVDQPRVEAALRQVFEGKADWVILAYVEGKKDEVELVASGSGGVNALKAQYPTNRIYFCVVATECQATGSRETVKKFTVVTLIGHDAKPLQKAKSAGQRQDITDFILSVVPVHGHYQPSHPGELTEETISSKYRD